MKQDNLNKKINQEEYTKKITEILIILKIGKEQIEKFKPEEQERAYNELNNELNQRINQLKSQKETVIKKNLNYWNNITTHCDYFKSNCHENCDCNFTVISKYSVDSEFLILLFLVKIIVKYVVVQRVNIDKIIIIIFIKK